MMELRSVTAGSDNLHRSLLICYSFMGLGFSNPLHYCESVSVNCIPLQVAL